MKNKRVNMVMGVKEWLLLVILSIMWGASFFFVEVAVRAVTPLTLVLCRVGIAAVLLLIFIKITGRVLPGDLKTWTGLFSKP